ncbi:hypothetical protein BIFGAL_03765 [Bifidobacterium gallicum DSM 20093 = LMG 11596]|uniref:Uncharacterized protein n=1 Tax=Bifidobacterium gallicum DSM 20093 = LMG 11596 TaxID=561180 RepID=D1NV81_9BIFI|nr:hypothetical protein BIFGAL_03765 [Bifidobacterium gallicum DSM 20093 = LMG 11596]
MEHFVYEFHGFTALALRFLDHIRMLTNELNIKHGATLPRQHDRNRRLRILWNRTGRTVERTLSPLFQQVDVSGATRFMTAFLQRSWATRAEVLQKADERYMESVAEGLRKRSQLGCRE